MKEINSILKSKGLTQKDLADMLGVTRVSIAKTLAGNPTVETLQRIAHALECDVVDLFVKPTTRTAATCPHCGKPIELKKAD